MQREIPGPLFQLAWQMLAVPRRRKYGGAHIFQVSRPYAVHLLRLLCTGMDSGSGDCELGTILCVLQRSLSAFRRYEIVYLPLLRFSSSAPQTQGRVPNCFLANWKILVYLRDRLGFFIVEQSLDIRGFLHQTTTSFSTALVLVQLAPFRSSLDNYTFA